MNALSKGIKELKEALADMMHANSALTDANEKLQEALIARDASAIIPTCIGRGGHQARPGWTKSQKAEQTSEQGRVKKTFLSGPSWVRKKS